jgi:hypothetical protein
MLTRACVYVLLLAAGACGGGNSTPTSPSNGTTTSPSDPTITFSGLTSDGVCTVPDSPSPSCAVRTYAESGFTVSTTSGAWFVRTDYGNPAPFILFEALAGSSGAIQVTAGGAAFGFKSVDLYSSLTPIAYTITGLRKSTTAFTMANTLPNTFGDFVTVVNPQAAATIDTLVISLSNATAGPSPMGLDNIVVTK